MIPLASSFQFILFMFLETFIYVTQFGLFQVIRVHCLCGCLTVSINFPSCKVAIAYLRWRSVLLRHSHTTCGCGRRSPPWRGTRTQRAAAELEGRVHAQGGPRRPRRAADTTGPRPRHVPPTFPTRPSLAYLPPAHEATDTHGSGHGADGLAVPAPAFAAGSSSLV